MIKYIFNAADYFKSVSQPNLNLNVQLIEKNLFLLIHI